MLTDTKKSVLLRPQTLRGRAVVARRAHNPEVVGSSPTPATKKSEKFFSDFSFFPPPLSIPPHPFGRFSPTTYRLIYRIKKNLYLPTKLGMTLQQGNIL